MTEWYHYVLVFSALMLNDWACRRIVARNVNAERERVYRYVRVRLREQAVKHEASHVYTATALRSIACEFDRSDS